MVRAVNLGTFYGIPIRVDLSWAIIAFIVTWSLVGGYFPKEFPSWAAGTYWLVGIATSLLLFASVLFHEMGHSIIAIREGVIVKNITLFILGGYIEIEGEPSNARAEFQIALAGPLSSMALAALFYLLAASLAGISEISGPARYLAATNLFLAAFNLIPAFPLDGGRVMRAVLWWLSGDYYRATDRALSAGQGIALCFILLAGGTVFLGNVVIGLWLGIIGWFLYHSAQANYKEALFAEVDERDPFRDFFRKP